MHERWKFCGLCGSRNGCEVLRWACVCVSVGLSVGSHVSNTTCRNFTKFAVLFIVTFGRSSVLLWRQSNTNTYFWFCGRHHVFTYFAKYRYRLGVRDVYSELFTAIRQMEPLKLRVRGRSLLSSIPLLKLYLTNSLTVKQFVGYADYCWSNYLTCVLYVVDLSATDELLYLKILKLWMKIGLRLLLYYPYVYFVAALSYAGPAEISVMV